MNLKVHVNGEWIKELRTRHHEKSKTLNIDLEFNHSQGYAINQIFTRAENIFGIVLTAEGKATNQEDIIAELKADESQQKIKIPFSGTNKKTGTAGNLELHNKNDQSAPRYSQSEDSKIIKRAH